MKKLFFGLLLAVMTLPAMAQTVTHEGTGQTATTVLLNFHDPACGICRKFERDIGKEGFDADPRARGVTMEILDYSKPPPAWIQPQYGPGGTIRPVSGTPTFVLYVKGEWRELGRIVGYGGEEWFWEQYKALVEQHPDELPQ